MIIIAYIGMLLLGALCITITVRTIKHQKEKDYDTEAFNQELQVQKGILEHAVSKLKEEEHRLTTSVTLLYEQLDDLEKDQIALHNIINRLNEQKDACVQQIRDRQVIVDNLRREYDWLEAQKGTLQRTIDEITSGQEAAARKVFENYCEALDYEYTEKEREFDAEVAHLDNLYGIQQDAFLQQIAANEQELARRKEECERDLDTIRSELDKIKSSRAAAIEAQLREQEIKDQATFYTLQLNEADKRDVCYLQSIEFNLREARPLRMLIWSTFYRDKVNDLAARVGAAGVSGIYKITHIDSGIAYIGQARDIKERWVKEVKEALGIDAPTTNQRCNFMREKGVDNFTFEILEKCSIAELNEKEKFYIDLYQTYEFGLNGNKGVGK